MIEVTKPRAIALGYFDGVHLGHRALMQRAVERAKQIGGTSAVFTFDVHPDSVVMGRQVPLLTANAYRTEEIKKLGGVTRLFSATLTMKCSTWTGAILSTSCSSVASMRAGLSRDAKPFRL